MVASFVVALVCAARAAEPCRFDYIGNDPSEWVIDLEKQKSFEHSLAEQAAFYSRDIKNNSDTLERNAGLLVSAAC